MKKILLGILTTIVIIGILIVGKIKIDEGNDEKCLLIKTDLEIQV